jgi:hypothetical protein
VFSLFDVFVIDFNLFEVNGTIYIVKKTRYIPLDIFLPLSLKMSTGLANRKERILK